MVNVSRTGLMVILLCASFNLQAAIKSSIDRSMIEQGESIRLSIDLRDVDGDKIDLKPLEEDFEVLGRSQQSSTVIRNGRVESSTELVLSLLPKRVGDLQVPAISIDGDKTNSHALRVTAVQQPSAVNGGIEMLSTLSSEHPKVQQPLIYQVNLLLGRQIFNASLQGPEIKTGKALIEPLGEQRQYRQTLNGREISVVEQTWLITPEQSGPLDISPAQIIGQIQTGRVSRNPYSRGFADPASMRRIQVSAEGYQLQVEPIPTSFSGKVWLPAENIILSDSWSLDHFTEGEPLTRTITLRADGVSRHQIAELTMPDIDGIKQYASTPAVEQHYDNDLLTSTLTLEVTLIPERAGELVLPEIRIPWWDVKSNSEKIALLATRNIHVDVAKNVQLQSTTSSSPAATAGSQMNDSLQKPTLPSQSPSTPLSGVQPNQTSQPSSEATNTASISIWWVALFGAIAGSIGTLVISWLLRKRNQQGSELEPMKSKPNSSSTLGIKLLNLKEACINNNAAAARLALIEWGQTFWPACSNLNQLSLKVTPELQLAITELHQHSYSQTVQEWQGMDLWNAVQSFDGKKSAARHNAEKLAPLFLS